MRLFLTISIWIWDVGTDANHYEDFLMSHKSLLLLICIAIISGSSDCLAAEKNVVIRGINGSPQYIWDKGLSLEECGINAIFIGQKTFSPELVARARREGAKVYAELPMLRGKNYVEDHPEAWPLNQKGEKAPPADWYLGACPTEKKFRTRRMKQVRALLHNFDVDGLWLDYLQGHALWESEAPILPETCFCENYLSVFQTSSGLELPSGNLADRAAFVLANYRKEWRDWRCSVLTAWAMDVRMIIEQERPGALLGIYLPPLREDEFDNALRNNFAVDLNQFAMVADVLSPLVYHRIAHRPASWVGDYVAWLNKRLKSGNRGMAVRVWNVIQADDRTGIVSPEEFEQVLRLGVSGDAEGVFMFTIRGVIENPAKLEVMKRVYREWSKRKY